MMYVSENLDQFNETFRQYHAAGKKSWEACVLKQSKEYAIRLAAVTKAMAPAPGSIRTRLIAMLKSGKGLLIKNYHQPGLKQGEMETPHNAIVERRLRGQFRNTKKNRERTAAVRAMFARVGIAMARNRIPSSGTISGAPVKLAFQALLADDEINIRESKRQFTRWSTQFRWKDKMEADSHIGNTALGRFKATTDTDGTAGQFIWGQTVGYHSSRAAFILGSTPKGRMMMDTAFAATRINMLMYLKDPATAGVRNAARAALVRRLSATIS